ncbi:hypothetical protein O6H91_07G021800 [Diphasiastrum complanatum]|uniref:Uncharacterized protein n=1 Tax=Diphasiastrum complanatum TaxID=34168 RepID=A0ACC2D365_DIPCM|nr:hypothetical protein O6H91_07G021800 [Diphasiastrum complanatum]
MTSLNPSTSLTNRSDISLDMQNKQAVALAANSPEPDLSVADNSRDHLRTVIAETPQQKEQITTITRGVQNSTFHDVVSNVPSLEANNKPEMSKQKGNPCVQPERGTSTIEVQS